LESVLFQEIIIEVEFIEMESKKEVVEKTALPAKRGFVSFALCVFAGCAVLWAGFLLSLCVGEKKQDKFPSNCTALSTEN
jgi:hypothetical protein